MVRRVLQLMYREVRGLHQAAYVLAAFAFGSQLLALVRDRLLAATFGADRELDLYYAAFKIPDVLFAVFAAALSVYVLLPFVHRIEANESTSTTQAFLSQVFTVFLLGYTVVAGLVAVSAPQLVAWLFPGLTADSETVVLLVRLLLLQPFLLGLSSLFGVVTQYRGRFVLYAVSPLLYNLGIIFGVALLYPLVGLSGLAYGVVLGAFLHVGVQWPLVQRSALAFHLTRTIEWARLTTVVQTAVPRAFTLGMTQVVLLSLIGIASTMAAGSVAVFQFAFNLHSVPLSIIGVSYSVAAFPTLSRLWTEQNFHAYTSHITTALHHIIFWSVPAVVLVVVLRAQIVRVILGSGSFDWADTRLTAAVLAVMILSLVAHATYLLLVRAFYAGGNTRVPLVTTVIGSVVGVGAAVLLREWFTLYPEQAHMVAETLRITDVPGSEVLVLAAGYALGIAAQTGLLVIYAWRQLGIGLRTVGDRLVRAVTAALLGGGLAYGTLQFVVDGINQDTFLGVLLQGGVAGLIGVCGVVAGYTLLRSPELTEVLAAARSRRLKTSVIGPQDEEAH